MTESDDELEQEVKPGLYTYIYLLSLAHLSNGMHLSPLYSCFTFRWRQRICGVHEVLMEYLGQFNLRLRMFALVIFVLC